MARNLTIFFFYAVSYKGNTFMGIKFWILDHFLMAELVGP